MIIKSLLFVIVCIFVYESFQILYKMKEEYFISLENFAEPRPFTPEEKDIRRTIINNCRQYKKNLNKEMIITKPSGKDLDTPYSAQFKPLEYNPDRKYYWNVHKLAQEGIRRSGDDEKEIEKVQKMFDEETDEDKKQILQDELNLYKWRDPKTKIAFEETKCGVIYKPNIKYSPEGNDIIKLIYTDERGNEVERRRSDVLTDYIPRNIGQQRLWQEIYSHLPDYSY